MSDQRDKSPQEPVPADAEEPEPQEQAGAAAPELEPDPGQRLAELEDRYQRAAADLANAHKRFQRERERTAKLAVAAFVAKLLPMIDNLSHSLKSAEQSHDPAALIEGFKLIEAQMLQILEESGIRPIPSAGQPFDPEVHHAVTTDITTDVPPGTVTEELGRGFVIDDFVIRPAHVKVAAAPPRADEAPPAPPVGPQGEPEGENKEGNR